MMMTMMIQCKPKDQSCKNNIEISILSQTASDHQIKGHQAVAQDGVDDDDTEPTQ